MEKKNKNKKSFVYDVHRGKCLTVRCRLMKRNRPSYAGDFIMNETPLLPIDEYVVDFLRQCGQIKEGWNRGDDFVVWKF